MDCNVKRLFLNDNYPTKRWLIIFGKNLALTHSYKVQRQIYGNVNINHYYCLDMDFSIFIFGLLTGLSFILAIGPQNLFVIEQGLKNQHVFLVCSICSLSDLFLIFLGIFLFHFLENFLNQTLENLLNIALILFLLNFIK